MIPTIKVFVQGHEGPVTINEADFDPSLQSKEEPKKEPKAPKEPKEPKEPKAPKEDK